MADTHFFAVVRSCAALGGFAGHPGFQLRRCAPSPFSACESEAHRHVGPHPFRRIFGKCRRLSSQVV